jgi:homocysteine S-methyltransferase
LEKQVRKINKTAVNLVRRVIDASFKDVLIAGDVGPLGVPLAPFGKVQAEEARDIYKEQIEALSEGGVDVILIETMTDLYMVREAINAAREICPDVPIIASMTFTRDDRTLLGDSPVKVAKMLEEYGADIFGVNCSGGPLQLLQILRTMKAAVPDGKYSVMPNAGFPEQVGGRIMYPAGAEYFRDYALAFWKAGACVIGGCCGTTPAHISILKQTITSYSHDQILTEISTHELPPIEEQLVTEKKSILAQKIKDKKFVLAVEVDPPRGFSTHKLLAGASLLADAGADVIDVADSPMARMRMSPWAVCHLIQNQFKVETTLHFPTRGRNLLRVQGDLLAAHALGIRNVFVVMGDPTAIGDYPDAMDNYDLVPTGLIKLIKEGFNAGFDHSGGEIGQPTSFFVGGALNLNPEDVNREAKIVHRKVEAGVDFFLTQPVFDVDKVHAFLKAYESLFGALEIPILAGILPLASSRHARFLHNEVPGIVIPQSIQDHMEACSEEGHKAGIKIAQELIEELKTIVQGIYFMPQFNRYDVVAEIITSIRQSE